MEKNILIINIGSSSKRYHLYSGDNLVAAAHFERDKDGFAATYLSEEKKTIISETYENSLSDFLAKAKVSGHIDDAKAISAIGLRLVAPGRYFTEDHFVNEEFLEKLRITAKSDMAHIKPVQTELEFIAKLLPDKTIITISDSAFHRTMPSVASRYALPDNLAEEQDLYRFGFHGISLASMVHTLANRLEGMEKRTIVCHLGNGVSVTALLNGESQDTSMGYSPLEGVVMSSRIGNIDADAVLRLAETIKINELREIFYMQSGLKGLSGLSPDMRVLLEAEKEGHAGACLAINAFVYNIRKCIGAYAVVLGGVDAIIFSGAIGEGSPVIRERICHEFEYLNIIIDSERNQNLTESFGEIGREGKARIYVISADEAGEILRRTALMIK